METKFAARSLRSTLDDIFPKDDDLALCLDSLEISDSESLSEEMKYQSGLQDWIFDNEELVDKTTEGRWENKTKCETRNKLSSAANITLDESTKSCKKSSSQQVQSDYLHLKYDPNWKNHQNSVCVKPFYIKVEDFLDEASISSDYLSDNETSAIVSQSSLPINGKPITKSVNVPAPPPGLSVTEGPSNNMQEPYNMNNKEPVVKMKSTVAHGPVSQQDFIEKNKLTLGTRAPKQSSYLKLHNKKVVDGPLGQASGSKSLQSDHVPTAGTGQVTNINFLPFKKEQNHQESKIKPSIVASHEVCEEQHEERSGVRVVPPSYILSNLSDKNISELQNSGHKIFSPNKRLSHTSICPDNVCAGNLSQNNFPCEELNDDYYLQIQNEILLYNQLKNTQPQYGRLIDSSTMRDDADNSHLRLTHYGLQDFMDLPSPVNRTNNSDMRKRQNCDVRSNSTDSGDSSQQVTKNSQMSEKHTKKLIGYLKQEVKLGGMGPQYQVSEEKKEQLRQQKEYAKAVQHKNRKTVITKVPEEQNVPNDTNKGKRHKSLEYAKNVPKPRVQPFPISSEQKNKDEPEKSPVLSDKLFPQLKLLQDLHARHKKEKEAVAALRALHML